ncbi:MAG: hypothetical protein RLZZ299_902 [Pseudomonadota bacterium]
MNRTDARHVLGLLVAVTFTVLAARGTGAARSRPAEAPSRATATLTDRTGHTVALRPWTRVASASIVADGVLAELAEPGRVVATTGWLAPPHPQAHRLANLPRVDPGAGPEALLALRADLWIVSDLRDAAARARLQAAGAAVFDVGPVGDAAVTARVIRDVAALLGASERGEALLARLARRVDNLRRRPLEPRPRAVYLSVAGDACWGGAQGTTYHDVLAAAGLRDAATEAGLRGWPQLGAEQLHTLDPDVLVGETGLRAQLCARDAFATLRACGPGGTLVELPGIVVSDPGPGWIDAAEMLRAALDAASTAGAGVP